MTTCVKQPYDLVKRPVAIKELYLAYDLQAKVQDVLIDHDLETTCLEYIVRAFPEKIAQTLVEGISQDLNQGDNTLYEMSVKNQTKVQMIIQEEELELNDEKAARNDDAEIQTLQWDMYLIRSFANTMTPNKDAAIPRPLICYAGAELTDKHTKLFEGLREIMLRRFRKNVYISFMTFMKSKYGPDWMSLVVVYHKLSTRQGKLRRELKRYLKDGALSEEFIKDMNCGVEAVERALCASFWDWDEGSSILFWRWPRIARAEARDGVPIFISGQLPRYKESQRWPREPDQKEAMI